MTKLLATLLTVGATSFVMAGCAERATDLPPGSYSKDVSSTDSSGTTTEHKSSTDVSVDSNGRKTAVVKSKTTQDPKGLFNKTTTQKSTVVEHDDE